MQKSYKKNSIYCERGEDGSLYSIFLILKAFKSSYTVFFLYHIESEFNNRTKKWTVHDCKDDTFEEIT